MDNATVPDNKVESTPKVVDNTTMPADSDTTFTYHGDMAEAPNETITWEADEFQAPERQFVWYLEAVVAVLLFSGIVYWLNRDVVTAVTVCVAFSVLLILHGRKPRRQTFLVTPQGVQIGNKAHWFADFRSFSIAVERSGHTLVLVPFKRFAPAVSVFIPDAQVDTVTAIMTSALPMEAHKPDALDWISTKFHL